MNWALPNGTTHFLKKTKNPTRTQKGNPTLNWKRGRFEIARRVEYSSRVPPACESNWGFDLGGMDYCENDTNEEFEGKILTELLGNLRRFDLRTKETKPLMAKARKRVIFGGKETRKMVELGRVKGWVIARNLSDETLTGKNTR